MSIRVLSAQRYSTRSFNNGLNPILENAIFLLKSAASNTFTDIGPNGYTVTNVGSVTSSNSTAKFSGTYSASFSGSNRLTVADTATLRPGTGSFTWDFWWYPTTLSSYITPMAKGYTTAGDLLLQTGAGDGKLIVYASGSAVLTSSTAVTINTWNHVALARNGTAMALYVNGASVGTATNSTNFNSTTALGIGDSAAGSIYASAGYIQDVRICNTAIYTGNFTPPDSMS